MPPAAFAAFLPEKPVNHLLGAVRSMNVTHRKMLTWVWFLLLALTAGCSHFGHYPVNAPPEKYEPGYGYIPRNMGPEGNSEELLLILTFSGGGTRAAAFSYGVLEELRATEVALGGKKRRLSDEVDIRKKGSGPAFCLLDVRQKARPDPTSSRSVACSPSCFIEPV
jgi:hypothetical protein